MTTPSNGKLLNYITVGEGPAIILIHGIAASLYEWASLIPDLALAGYSVYAMDLLGHGASLKPSDPAHYTLDAVYAALEKWVENIQIDPPFVLVGHSLGGHLSLNYGLRNQEKVRAMVLIDPLYSLRQLSPLLRWLKRSPSLGVKALQVMPYKLINFFLGWDHTSRTWFSPQVRLQIASDYMRASPHILNIPRTIPDLTPRLNHINVPSLVIWGEKDLTLKPDSFRALVSALPIATGKNIPGSGHLPHIGKPRLVNRLIVDFLNPRQVDSQ